MKHAFKKIMAFLLVAAMIIGVLPSVFAAGYTEPFKDVKEDDWFAPYVTYAYNHDPQLMDGVTPILFDPNGTCTRAMAAVVLYRLADPVVPPVNASKFVDLKENWYKNAVAWAQENEVVNGVDATHFDPYGLVTREQLVTMIWRFYGELEIEKDYLKDFPDAKKVSPYAVDAFNWAISKGIIGGSLDDGKLTLNPQGHATRAELAKIISVAEQVMFPCTEHKWNEGEVVSKPTCEDEGEMLYTCTQCGETKTESIPALGHKYVDGVCSVCGDKLADKGEVVIYYTNDVHTYIDGSLSYDNIADLKAQTAKVADGVLLVDAGDHVQGTAYGSMDKGKSIIELMSAADYDLATLGNHEFDYGMERTLEIVQQADFPYVSCNFYHESNGVKGSNVLDSYKIFEVGGKKIAIIGVTTPESFTKSTPAYFQDAAGNYIYGIAGGVTGADLYNAVQAAINAAKAEKPDYIIALGHLGDDSSSEPWTSEKLIANTTGLDAFIDGHSHSTVAMKSVRDKAGNTVVLTQTGSYFNAIGKMTITDSGIKTELITSFNGSNAAVASIKNSWINTVNDLLGEVIGHTSVKFDNYDADGNRLVRKQETNTGDFAADALYYLFDNMGLDVDVAIMNGGGVRNKAVTGDISYMTCKNIHTFGNVACLQTITGQQLLDALEWGSRDVGTAECGGFLQVSGITYDIYTNVASTVQKDSKGVWTGGPTGDYRVQNVKVYNKETGKYEALDLKAEYNLAGYNYTLRDLGDGFAMFKGAVNVLDYVMEDYMVLANYVKSFPVVSGKHEITATNSVLSYLGVDYGTVNGSGRINVTSGTPSDITGSNTYVLSASVKDGDKVIIYNPGHGMAIKNETDNDWYLIPQEVTPTDNKIVTDDATLVWTVKENTDGTYSFTNGENKIMMWLSEQDGKTYFELTNNANYAGATGEWKLISGNAANKLYYIQHSTLANSYGPAYIECFYNANKDTTKISGYSSSKPTEKDFGFQFFVQGAEEETPTEPTEPTNPSEPTEPTSPAGGNTYVLSNTLKVGDEVIIVCAAKNIALGADYGTSYYNPGVAVTPVNNKITTEDATIVWTVGKEGDFYTFSYNGQKIGMGTEYTSMTLGAVNYKWQVEAAATENAFYVKNLDRDASKPYYMQWYEGKGYWSGYHTLNEELMALSFYVKTEEGVTPTEPTEPTNPSEPTEPTSPAGGNTYVLSDSLKDGDKVIIVNKDTNKAISEDVVTGGDKNYRAGADVTPVDSKITTNDSKIVWDVVKTDNGYQFKNDAGETLSAASGLDFATTDNVWAIEAATSMTGCYFIKNTTAAGSSGDLKAIEWYAAKGNFSTFYIGSADETLFAMQFYVLSGSSENPTEPTNPTEPSEPTTPSESTTPSTPVSGNTYVLTNTLKDGDKVIIVNKDTNKAISEDVVTGGDKNYRAGADVTPAEGKITTSDSKIVWDVVKTDDGYQFKNDAGETLSAASGLDFATTDNVWAIEAATSMTGCYFIKNTTAAGSSGDPKAIEWYAAKGNFSTFYIGSADETLFAMQFYVLSGSSETPTEPTEPTNPSEPTEPTSPAGGNTYVLSDSLKDGDKVVIYNPGLSRAASSVMFGSWAVRGEEVTLKDDTITTDDENLVWTVEVNDDGSYSFYQGDLTLSVWLSGNYVEISNDAQYDNTWTLETCNAANKTFYVYSSNLTTSYGNAYLECYNKTYSGETNQAFCGYSTGTDNINETNYGMQFYVKSDEVACAHEWDAGTVTVEAKCTTTGVKTYTCALCGATKTEEIPATGHTDTNSDNKCDACGANLAAAPYSIASSLSVGDKIVIVVSYEGKYYAAANDTKTVNNALNAVEVDVTAGGLVLPDGVDLVWEVCAGSAEGAVTLKSSDGTYISNPSKTNVSLSAEAGADLTITCGDGTSKLLLTSTASATTVRNLFLRMNNGVPQFRFYSTDNATVSGYSSVLTIWKAN